jgi:uncharacterized membrane protein YhfC
MVSATALSYMVITLLLSLVLPFVLLIFLVRGRKGVFGTWVAGAIGFVLPQLIIRIPLLQLLGTLPAVRDFSESQPYIFVFLLALTAGLFETAGRLLVFKAILPRRLSYVTGLAAGAGHGAAESIVIVGMTYVNNLVISLFINSGNLEALMPGNPEMAETIRRQILDVSPELFLMAGLERVFTMILHISLSILLVWFIMKSHAITGFIIVASIHFAVDFATGVMQTLDWSPYLIEGFILAIAILSLIYIVIARSRFKDNLNIPSDPAEQAVIEGY